MERCVCGRMLDLNDVEIVRSPCRCDVPGPGPRTLEAPGVKVPKYQYEQRRKLGLPVETPVELAARRRW